MKYPHFTWNSDIFPGEEELPEVRYGEEDLQPTVSKTGVLDILQAEGGSTHLLRQVGRCTFLTPCPSWWSGGLPRLLAARGWLVDIHRLLLSLLRKLLGFVCVGKIPRWFELLPRLTHFPLIWQVSPTSPHTGVIVCSKITTSPSPGVIVCSKITTSPSPGVSP